MVGKILTDGHLLPDTGEHKVHHAYHTQRRMPTPGQTNLVTCDGQGRVVCFDIQEGKGDLRARILALGDYAREQALGVMPLQEVFDREGDGLGFFAALVAQQTPFVTWEKHADAARLRALEAACFTEAVSINGTDYRLLEEIKSCSFKPEPSQQDAAAAPEQRFELRRVVLWNLRTDHRTSVLCWDGTLGLTPAFLRFREVWRYLNLDHLRRCIETLQQSLRLYQSAEPDGIEQEVFRNAIVKGYELTQELAFKLLKKALEAFGHDYGEAFARETLTLMPGFLEDVSHGQAGTAASSV